MIALLLSLIALNQNVIDEINAKYTGNDEEMVDLLIREKYIQNNQTQEVTEYLKATYPSSIFSSITEKYQSLNLEDITGAFLNKLAKMPSFLQDFVKNHPDFLRFLALLVKDQNALSSLAGIVTNYRRLLGFIFLYLLTVLLAYFMKRWSSNFKKKWTRFRLFLFRFLFIFAIRIALFIYIFQNNLRPTWELFQETILK